MHPFSSITVSLDWNVIPSLGSITAFNLSLNLMPQIFIHLKSENGDDADDVLGQLIYAYTNCTFNQD